MTKKEIRNNTDFYDYCYKKARENVIENWNLNDEKIEEVNLNECFILKEFFKMFELKYENPLKKVQKMYKGKRLKEKRNEILKNTKIFISRIEYLITRRIIH